MRYFPRASSSLPRPTRVRVDTWAMRITGCRCSEHQVNHYQAKLGGPLKDRIDLICEVSRVDPSRVLESGRGTSSAQIAELVCAARERAVGAEVMLRRWAT